MCDSIIVTCVAALMVMGGFSFFIDPSYEKGVWIVLIAVSNLLSAAAGAKFGLAMPQFGIGVREETDETKTGDRPSSSDAGDGPRYRVGFASGIDKHPTG